MQVSIHKIAIIQYTPRGLDCAQEPLSLFNTPPLSYNLLLSLYIEYIFLFLIYFFLSYFFTQPRYQPWTLCLDLGKALLLPLLFFYLLLVSHPSVRVQCTKLQVTIFISECTLYTVQCILHFQMLRSLESLGSN